MGSIKPPHVTILYIAYLVYMNIQLVDSSCSSTEKLLTIFITGMVTGFIQDNKMPMYNTHTDIIQ